MKFKCIYVRDNGCMHYAEMLVKGYKTVETRRIDSLSSIVNMPVGVIRIDYKGRKSLVGFITLGEAYKYEDYGSFRGEYNKHLVNEGSLYDFKDKKVGYPVKYHYWFQPIELSQHQIKQVVPRRVCELNINL